MPLTVQRGVFDPREYKQSDPNWTKKRKPEVMGPGKIIYTREFMEDETPLETRFLRQDLVAQFREKQKRSSLSPEPSRGSSASPEPVHVPHYTDVGRDSLSPEPAYVEPEPEPEPEPVAEPVAEPVNIQINRIEDKKPIELWPKRQRSDITMLYR